MSTGLWGLLRGRRTVRVLFVASNPKDMGLVSSGTEYDWIEAALKQQVGELVWELYSVECATPQAIESAIRTHRPHLVHFCLHGTEDEHIIFEDEHRVAIDCPMDAFGDRLVAVDRATGQLIRCIVLNMCYGGPLADRVAGHFDHVLALDGALGDTIARKFAEKFYLALALAAPFEDAVRNARAALRQGAFGESETLVVTGKRKGARAPNKRWAPPGRGPLCSWALVLAAMAVLGIFVWVRRGTPEQTRSSDNANHVGEVIAPGATAVVSGQSELADVRTEREAIAQATSSAQGGAHSNDAQLPAQTTPALSSQGGASSYRGQSPPTTPTKRKPEPQTTSAGKKKTTPNSQTLAKPNVGGRPWDHTRFPAGRPHVDQ